MTDNTLYTATLKLTQTGVDGDVNIAVSFDPAISDEQIQNDEIAPTVFVQMTSLVQDWMIRSGIIDDDGNLLDPDLLVAAAEFNLRERGEKTLN